jgi:hypothetical protein
MTNVFTTRRRIEAGAALFGALAVMSGCGEKRAPGPLTAKPSAVDQHAPCPAPMPPEFQGKTIGIIDYRPSEELLPGTRRSLGVGVDQEGPWGKYRALGVCARWSVTPEAMATIDRGGVLQVAANAGGGAIEVKAELATGETAMWTAVVRDPKNPVLSGVWHERGSARCRGARHPDVPIGELKLTEDGRFSVTWQPFETYVDYWGRYTVTGDTMRWVVEGGNLIPPHLDLEGQFSLTPDALTLSEMFLGAQKAGVDSDDGSCEYSFGR